jgi:hypothetical protein
MAGFAVPSSVRPKSESGNPSFPLPALDTAVVMVTGEGVVSPVFSNLEGHSQLNMQMDWP